MKKITILSLLMLCMLASHVFAAETAISVVLQDYDPYPAEPGSYITAKFRATNVGNNAASNYIVELQPKYPFTLDPTEEAVKTFGAINPEDSVVFEYKIRVDEKAVIGNNELSLRDSADGGSTWLKETFNVLVKVTDAVLSVSDITTSPEQFSPGEKGSLDITLENLAGTSLKDVTVKLDLETQTSPTTGATIQDLPFAPLYSTTEKKIRFLNGGESQTISFDLVTYPSAESTLYKLPMTISYTDESGNTFSKTDLVGVVVGSKPKLTTLVESSEIRSAGGSGEVVIKFINKGVTNIKFLNVMIKENDMVKVLATTNQVYIGNLDSDDYDTAAFRLKVASGADGSVTLPVVVEYMDANNKEYKEEINLPLEILSANDLGVEKKSPVGTIVVVLIVIGVIAFLIFRRKKKKQHK